MRNKIRPVKPDPRLISYVEKGVFPVWVGVILISICAIVMLLLLMSWVIEIIT